MPIRRTFLVRLPLLLLCAQSGVASAATDDVACTTVALQKQRTTELRESGSYCLRSDIQWSATGPVFVISGANITLNMNGHHIRGLQGKHGQIGIVVSDQSENIQIANGSIESMQVGMRAQEVKRLAIRDMRFTNIAWLGVHISGSKSTIVNSHFSAIGHIDDGENEDGYAIGILASGREISIEGNRFDKVTRQPVNDKSTGEGVAVLLTEHSESVSIKNNFFSTDLANLAQSFGIWGRTKDVVISQNQFRNFESPIAGAYLGNTLLTENQFILELVGPAVHSKVGPRARFMAVAMSFTESSSGTFAGNSFRGYACPIRLSENASRQRLKIGSNRVSWPTGPRFCAETGYWYSNAIFGPQGSPTPRGDL